MHRVGPLAKRRGPLSGAPPQGRRRWCQRRVRHLVSLSQTVHTPANPHPPAPPLLVGMLQAKTHLSRLVLALEAGAVEEILIARHGRPVARLTRLRAAAGPVRIGALAQARAQSQATTP